MTSSPSAVQDHTYGPILARTFDFVYWGVIVTIGFYGIAVAQGWAYFHSHKGRDKWYTRLFVSVLLATELVATIIVSRMGYYLFVKTYGIPEAAYRLPPQSAVSCFLTVFIKFSAQIFFVTRIYTLKPQARIGLALIVLTSTTSMVAGMVMTAKVITHTEVSLFASTPMKIAVGLHIGFSLLTDISATFCLASWTVSGIRHTFQSSNLFLKNLLVYIVGRGFFLSALQIACFIFYLLHTDELLWTPFYFCISKSYIITMFAILNSRTDREELIPTFVPPSSTLQIPSPGSSRTVTPEPWEPLPKA